MMAGEALPESFLGDLHRCGLVRSQATIPKVKVEFFVTHNRSSLYPIRLLDKEERHHVAQL